MPLAPARLPFRLIPQAAGNCIASGIYFVKLRSNELKISQKILLLR